MKVLPIKLYSWLVPIKAEGEGKYDNLSIVSREDI